MGRSAVWGRIAILVSLWGGVVTSFGALKHGRYAGYLHLPKAKMKIATVLDTVPITTSDGATALAAFLKFSFGGFHSHEYITHVYWDPDYDGQSNELVLDAASHSLARDITVNGRISPSGDHIAGEVSSQRGGIKGAKLELLYLSASHLVDGKKERIAVDLSHLFAQVPVYPTLTGTYYNARNSLIKAIQFELTKQAGVTSNGATLLEGYTIRGRVVEPEPFEPAPYRIKEAINSFEDFRYKVYLGELFFPKNSLLGTCHRNENGFDCDGCSFTAVKEEQPFLEALSKKKFSSNILPFPKPAPDAEPISPQTLKTNLAGQELFGYLHMEERDLMLPFAMTLNVVGQGERNNPTIAKRSITFLPRWYPQLSREHGDPELFTPIEVDEFKVEDKIELPIALHSSNGDLLYIERWTSEGMAGVFYSGNFARVGTFSLTTDKASMYHTEVPAIPSSFLGPPQKWKGSAFGWLQTQLDLHWIANISGTPSRYQLGGTLYGLWDSFYPFYDKNLSWYLPLENVRFDGFTGVFGADTRSESGTQSVIGKIEGNQVYYVFNSNAPLNNPTTLNHDLLLLRRDQKYGRVSVPTNLILAPNRVHLFMPFDALVFFNGIRMKASEGLGYRIHDIPSANEREGKVRLEIVFQLKTGRKVSSSLFFNPSDYKNRPLVVDFYEEEGNTPIQLLESQKRR